MEIDIASRKIRYPGNTRLDIVRGPVNIDGALSVTGAQTQTGDLDVVGAIGTKQAAADAGAELRLVHKQIIHAVVGGGITETLDDAIPANAWVMGVHGKIKVTVTGTTIASFLLGVTGDTNRFGNFEALTKNTVVTPAEAQAESVGIGRYYDAATDILLTGDAGTFTAGEVTIDIYYADLSPVDNYA